MIYQGNTAIASSKSCTIDVEGEAIEVSSATDGDWTHYIAGRKSWQVTVSFLVAATNDYTSLLDVGTTYTLGIAGSAGMNTPPALRGSAICTRCSVTATKGNIAQGSFVFIGNGPLATVV